MFFGDNDIWAAFGLVNPDAGADETDTAEPSEQPEGENEAEVAELPDDVEDIEDTDANDDITEGAEGPDNTETKPEQSKSERAKQAAARRAREQEAAINAAVQAALQQERAAQDAKWNDFFQRAGMRDPNRDNKLITNLEEYNQYRSTFDLKQAEQDLKKGRLTPEALQQVVAQMPQMQQIQQMQQQAAKQAQQAQQQAQQQRIANEIAEIGKLDPTITSFESLMQSENGLQVFEYVKRGGGGINLVEAYKLANMDKLTEKAAAAARAQRTSSEQSKQHLRSTTSRGQGSVEIPRDQMEAYRKMMPDATEAEIRKHYSKYLKASKK